MITYDSELKIFYSTKINDSRFSCGFSTKLIGDARNTSAILDFSAKNYSSVKSVVILDQIHSANIAIFTPPNPHNIEKIEETDGVITNLKNIFLSVQTADCVPMVVVDKASGIIGISHQGWRGSLKRLPQKMVKEMVRFGAKKEAVVVALGPSIGQCCYHIDEDRYHDFLDEFEQYADEIFQYRGGKYFLNLSRLDFLLLLEGGVNRSNIDFFPFCTSCDKQRFYSNRRDRIKEYGEMVSFVISL